MQRLQIFRSGTHVSAAGETLTFTDAELSASVSAYDPNLHEAPMVVGHPKTDSPAYGWIGDLDYREGVVEAEPVQVDAAFADLVRKGRFKKISASFYRPDAETNPKPGVYYLRHVGFLGAAAPAVKGLKSAEFTGSDKDIIEFGWSETDNAKLWDGLRDWLIEKFSLEEADKVVPSYLVQSLTREAAVEEPYPNYIEPTQEIDVDRKEIERAQADLDKQKSEQDAAFAEREKAIEARERKALEDEVTEYVDGLVTAGRLLPRFKTGLVATLVTLPTTEVEFAEGDATVKKSPGDVIREIFDVLPKQIEFGEFARDTGARPKQLTSKQLAAKAEVIVEEARSKGRHISYTEAMSQVCEAEGVEL